MGQLTIPGVEEPATGDNFRTPDPLARFLLNLLPWQESFRVLEPHAGGGAFVRAALLRGADVMAMDVDPECWAVRHGVAVVRDFLAPDLLIPPPDRIVMNPPAFDMAHVERALELCDDVAALLPLTHLESLDRLPFWEKHPPTRVWVLAERVWPTVGAMAWYHWSPDYYGSTSRLRVVSWKGPVVG